MKAHHVLASGAGLGLLAVALGAFGAHALKGIVLPEQLVIFETGNRYQMYHALALLVVGLGLRQTSCAMFRYSAWCFIGGIVLFSGSLYVLALTGFKSFGAITPVGGLLFLIGWGCLGMGWLRSSAP